MTDTYAPDTKESAEEGSNYDGAQAEKPMGESSHNFSGTTDGAEDTEGMDVKAKALMHLLKTSSVINYFATLPMNYFEARHSQFLLKLGLCRNHVRENEEAAGRGKTTRRPPKI